MARETGKERKSRIELTYYRRPDALALWRRGIAAVLVALAVGWIVLAPLWEPGRRPRWSFFQWNRLASPGRLAEPHSAWESACEACHVPFVAMNSSRWSPLPAFHSETSASKCLACHAAPKHAEAERAADVPACAECHRDHNGRDRQLARSPDSTCTRCHDDLSAHRDPAATGAGRRVEDRVSRFDLNGHPEFAALRTDSGGDPGRLKFNHALHLAEGLTLEQGGIPFGFDRLPEEARARYGWVSGMDLKTGVRLECGSCHRLSDGTTPTNGRTFLPVRYEQDCRACHALAFDPRVPERRVTHGMQPQGLIEELRSTYASLALNEDLGLLGRRIPARSLPGRVDPLDTALAEAIEARVASAARRLLGGGTESRAGCVECHYLSGVEPGARSSDQFARLFIESANIPAVWMRGAVFDHAAHRGVTCASCHDAAARSQSHTDVLLPGIATCVQCHAPRSETSRGAFGGMGYGCTECHRYHAAGQPEPSRGAELHAPDVRRSIEELLRGQ